MAEDDAQRNGRPVRGGRAVKLAREQLADLTGRDVEGVLELEPLEEGGWKVSLEVVELRRVPDSTDVLGVYDVELDEDGELMGYWRRRRYYRAQVET